MTYYLHLLDVFTLALILLRIYFWAEWHSILRKRELDRQDSKESNHELVKAMLDQVGVLNEERDKVFRAAELERDKRYWEQWEKANARLRNLEEKVGMVN